MTLRPGTVILATFRLQRGGGDPSAPPNVTDTIIAQVCLWILDIKHLDLYSLKLQIVDSICIDTESIIYMYFDLLLLIQPNHTLK